MTTMKSIPSEIEASRTLKAEQRELLKVVSAFENFGLEPELSSPYLWKWNTAQIPVQQLMKVH